MQAELPTIEFHDETDSDNSPPWENKCGRRNKSCSHCGRRFLKEEYDTWNCPACGTDRHCCNGPIGGIKGNACKLHGGHSLIGSNAGAFKSGRYSNHLPARLVSSYEAAESDPQLIEHHAEVSALTAFAQDLMRRLEGNDSSQFRGELLGLLEKCVDAGKHPNADKRVERFNAAFAELGAEIRKGADHDAALASIRAVMLERANIADREAKRLKERELAIGVAEAMILIGALQQAVSDEVTDEKAKRKIAERFAAILHGGVVKGVERLEASVKSGGSGT